MAEEVRDAALAIPRAILIVYVTNFIFMFPMLLTFLYHMPDPAAALDDDTTYPAMYVLRQSMSTSWLTGLLLVIIALLVCSNITFLTATSRALFAFARDNGLPYSIWISSIDRKRRVPQNAAMLTCVLSTALTLIYIGSHVAFYAITSLFTVAIIQSYCLSIGCVLWRRIYHPETLPYAQFSLGRFGIMINSMAVIYGIWCFFWSLWPQQYPVTASGFNWASVMYGATLAAALLHYAFVGRHKYQGPVSLVEERKLLSASF
ncbi:hypothetical protein QQS21_012249 [Conoideocrella luteorostrata]|uniref:Uncharacterized protein n=1 Tax=Conoideocrella luteorostrata TaxID=1105319 RepID=A0AAJ0CG27_9HYPO|nr:hypothetical protein QQS21_012249 [Conoideocrella luteorostrata]